MNSRCGQCGRFVKDLDEAHAAIRDMKAALEMARTCLLAWNRVWPSTADEAEYLQSPEIRAIDAALDASAIRRARRKA